MKAGGYTCLTDFMLLLEHPSINVNLRNELGNTVLMSAISDRASLMVQLILEVPSLNIHMVTKVINTTVCSVYLAFFGHISAYSYQYYRVKYKCVCVIQNGQSALQLAQDLGCYDITEILEEHLATVKGCKSALASIACDVCYVLNGLV
ncbi:hypothetical protein EON64_01270 [archaeon]|nr:MAG: hypothetical protein EON64_01270 [archaeon]